MNMRFVCRTLTLALVAMMSLLSSEAHAASTKTKQPPAPPGSIAGSVKSGASFVPDAVVHVWRDGKEVGAPHADQQGHFEFPTPEGTYEVQASAPHFQPAITIRITVVVQSQHQTWVNLELRPAP